MWPQRSTAVFEHAWTRLRCSCRENGRSNHFPVLPFKALLLTSSQKRTWTTTRLNGPGSTTAPACKGVQGSKPGFIEGQGHGQLPAREKQKTFRFVMKAVREPTDAASACARAVGHVRSRTGYASPAGHDYLRIYI